MGDHLCRPELPEQRLQLVRQGVALPPDDARVSVAEWPSRGLLGQPRARREHLARFDQ